MKIFLIANPPIGLTLTPRTSCTMSVVFNPSATGTRTGTLNVTDNAAGSYLRVIEPGVNGTLATTVSARSPELASGHFRPRFPGAIIAARGHTAATGVARIQHG